MIRDMAKIYVGCKLPNGIIMEIIKPHEMKQSILPAPTGDRVTLNGANSSRIARTNPADAAYGLTLVDEEFARAWFKANANAKFITSGAVFMVADDKAFKAEAEDRHEEVRTGLEPFKTDGTDPRQPEGVEADKDQLKRLGVRV
jgi:hypothetical protein